jgi:hypothetical protein
MFQSGFFVRLSSLQEIHSALSKVGEKELDFVLEMDGKVIAIAIEAKYSSRVGFRDAENILFLKDVLSNWTAGLIVYNGSNVLTLGQNVYAVPWAMI